LQYLPFLYGFLAFKFRIQDITDTLIKRANGVTRVNPFGGNSYIEQAVSKTFWFLWRIAMPLLLWRIPVGEYFLLFVISEMSTGWWLTFNFQVSHVSPQLAFPNLPEDGSKKLAEEWAVQQVMGTIDYAHGNWIATFLCGALNYQTVHHLFPGSSPLFRVTIFRRQKID
jgi:fatty acid desaturase